MHLSSLKDGHDGCLPGVNMPASVHASAKTPGSGPRTLRLPPCRRMPLSCWTRDHCKGSTLARLNVSNTSAPVGPSSATPC